MSALDVTRVPIYRPYPDEMPWQLLAEAGVDEQALTDALEPNMVRVAKHDGEPVGAYGIRRRSATCYELLVLVVARGYRGKGLGRWLLGHAIGLAETKGAREIVAAGHADADGQRLLARAGFELDGAGLRLVLTPE